MPEIKIGFEDNLILGSYGGVAKRALTFRYVTWPIILFCRHTSASLGGIYDWLSEETLLPRSNIVFHIGALPSLSFPLLLAVPTPQELLLLAASALNGNPVLLSCPSSKMRNYISFDYIIRQMTIGYSCVAKRERERKKGCR